MFNYVIFFWLCSVKVTQCHQIKIPKQLFVDHYDCVSYGYRYSTNLLEKKFKRTEVNRLNLFTRFTCTEKRKDVEKGKDV